jgi:tetratricopeptide (TPR) repeat protein
LRQARRRDLASVVVSGLAIGMTALLRAVVLVWVPLLLIRLWRRERHQALALAAAVALPIAPVTVRNYVVEHDVVLITANFGLNLYVGNHPRATGAYVLPEGLWFRPGDPADDYAGYDAATRALGHRPRSSELSAWWSGRALRFIAHEPSRALALGAAKLALLVNDYEYPQLYNYYGYATICLILRVLPTAGWVIAPGLVGLALALFRPRRDDERLLASMALLFALSFVPFFVVDRYRCAWLPLLAPFAARALAQLADALRRRSWAPAGALFAGTLLSAGAAFAHVDGPTVAPQYFAFGEARFADHDVEGALSWYRRAAAADPRDARVQANMGVTLAELGRLDEAEAALRRAAESWPGSERIQNDLGLVYRRLGRNEEAARAFRAAIQLNPTLVEAWVGLAELLSQTGDLAGAGDAIDTALRLTPPAARPALHARLRTLGIQVER